MGGLSIWHLLIIFGLPLIGLYLLPTWIALGRIHHNRWAIFALDLLLGWTVLGWVGALIWSLTVVQKAPTKPN